MGPGSYLTTLAAHALDTFHDRIGPVQEWVGSTAVVDQPRLGLAILCGRYRSGGDAQGGDKAALPMATEAEHRCRGGHECSLG